MEFYWNSIEIRSKFYGDSIEIVLNLYRNSIEILSKYYRNYIENLWKTLDSKCNRYTWGLGKAEERKCRKVLVFVCFFEGQSGDDYSREEFQPSGPDRLGGGRGKVNPPACGLVCGFGRFGGFGNWFGASTRLEAQGLGGFF